MQLQVQQRTAYRRKCFWNYVQCLSVFAQATTDATGKSRINNSCSSLSSQLDEKNSSRYTYTPPDTFDADCPDTGKIRPGDWRNDHETRFEDLPRISRKSAIKAAEVRDEFREYFCSKQGEISWHYHYC
jgi:hypothetical protein